MWRDSLIAKLRDIGLPTPQSYLAHAFSRNRGLLTAAEQATLADATVAIPGMGGVGGSHLITLVRTGVGRFHLAEFDAYEPANVNRQYGATVPSFGRPKLDVMMEQAYAINPYLDIAAFPAGIDPGNIDAFLDGVQVVLDAIDFFAFDARRLLFNRARERGIHVVTAAPLGFSSAVLVFAPDAGMSFDEYFHIVEGMRPEDRYLAFGVGLAPRPTHLRYIDRSSVSLTAKTGPSLGIACQVASGMAATEAVRILLKRGGVKPVPYYCQFDPYRRKFRQGRLYLGNRNPVQRAKIRLVKTIFLGQPSPAPPAIPAAPRDDVTGPKLSQSTLEYVVRAGIQAPSIDNLQPWKFRAEGRTISLSLDRRVDESFINFDQLPAIISCGAVIQNMRVAATCCGLRADVTYLPSGSHADHMATLEFTPRAVPKDPLAGALWTRRTNRTHYARRPLPRGTRDQLTACVAGFPGARLDVLTEPTELDELAKLVYEVDRLRTEHRALHEHFHGTLRVSPAEGHEKRDGLPLETLEVGRAGEVFLRSTRRWGVMRVANRVGIGKLVAVHGARAVREAAATALVTVPGIEAEHLLQGGEAVERLWLTLTAEGLSVQPMTGLTLFWLRWQREGGRSFEPAHRRLLEGVWPRYQGLFPEAHRDGRGHVMLLRIGYGAAVRHVTPRKDVAQLLE